MMRRTSLPLPASLFLLLATIGFSRCSNTPESQTIEAATQELPSDSLRIMVVLPSPLDTSYWDSLKQHLQKQFPDSLALEIFLTTENPLMQAGEGNQRWHDDKNLILIPDSTVSATETPPLELWSFSAFGAAGLEAYSGVFNHGFTSLDASGQGPLGNLAAVQSESGMGNTMSEPTRQAFQRPNTGAPLTNEPNSGPEPTGGKMLATRQVNLAPRDSTDTTWTTQGAAYTSWESYTAPEAEDEDLGEIWAQASEDTLSSQDQFRLIDQAVRFSQLAIRQQEDLQRLIELAKQHALPDLYRAWFGVDTLSQTEMEERIADGTSALQALSTQTRILDSLVHQTVFVTEQAWIVLEMSPSMVDELGKQEKSLTEIMRSNGLYPENLHDSEFVDSTGYFEQHDYFTWDMEELKTTYQRLNTFSK
ncbi:MAG: hypothetical protein AAFQ98_17335 [Bacteroidota bacterium]